MISDARRRLAAIAGTAALLVLASWAALRPRVPSTAPDILLVTLDTLRADALSHYHPAGATTPELTALVHGATLFERAFTPMPLTRPAHFSLLTGLYPREHGVLNNVMRLPDEVVTVPELLEEAGYRTAGFVAVELLGPGSGAERGFASFEAPPRGTRQRRGQPVVSRALAWTRAAPAGVPVLLWVHLFDPHQPYDPPAAHRGGVDPRLAGEWPTLDWQRLDAVAARHGGDVPADVLAHARALYRGDVESALAALSRLLEGFARARAGRQRLVLLAADHGECFEQGIYFEHADCLLEAALRVPLVLQLPGRREATRVAAPVSLLDAAPTILRAAGLPVPAGLSGRALQDPPQSARALLVQQPLFPAGELPYRDRTIRSVAGEPVRPARVGVDLAGVAVRDWIYLRGGGSEELRALRAVSGDERDVASEQPATAARLRAVLEAELARRPLVVAAPERIRSELREALRALGYLR